ncbi:M61 family metallopeptidase [uncultured Hymenobacter sp.]|uniref:M61 family metallopeptidase n=1 Tax=uncultured Hymenobacter sp. TaxID=170016 RepID=UPI0035CC2F3A
MIISFSGRPRRTLAAGRRLLGLLTFLWLTGLTGLSAAPAAAPTLRYSLAMPAPQTHYFEVGMRLGGFGADYTDLKMPVWAPGSYLVREFARHVEDFKATTAGGQALAVEKINKNTWRVRHAKAADFNVSYRVYAFELSVRTSFLDADHGYLNGSSIFMYPAENQALGSTLTVQPAAGWNQVSTALRPAGGVGAGKFVFQAANYDELADSPIEIGNQKILNFTANGTPHVVAMYGTYQADEARLVADMKRVCETAHQVVGQNPLDRSYVFIVHNVERGGGGLEHLYSTTLGVSRTAYASEAGLRSFLGLVAHEYFHLWNVKRIRPVALGPFDYDKENYTRMLWVSEGFTEYTSNQVMQRAGFLTRELYLSSLSSIISGLENQPGNRVQAASEASFDAWIKQYRPNENSFNTTISYYDKGEAIGVVLDLMIINATKGGKSLDDVYRVLYDKYYKGFKRGFTDQEFQDAVAVVAGQRFDSFFKTRVYDTQPLDYNTALGYAGLHLTSEPSAAEGTLGIGLTGGNGRLFVARTLRDGAAYTGGLNVNDEILSLDGQKITAADDLTRALAGRPTGTAVKMQVRRDGLPRDLSLTLSAAPLRYSIQPLPAAPTAAQQAVLNKWLRPQI